AAAFADSVTIQGNGAKSTNVAGILNINATFVSQNNETVAITLVSSKANTGGNTANGNTGGNVSVDAGNATSTVNTTVRGSTNYAAIPCGCSEGTTDIKVKGNGADSTNIAGAANINLSKTRQKNRTFAVTAVRSRARTGGNTANGNTGPGSVTVGTTGNASSTVYTTVGGSSNTLNP
ncbi:MAG: hypothetical protein COX78_00420, partial [Candidatus Levybacteria bacterium CG_4_10_14_0_2_um_filter_35_8]